MDPKENPVSTPRTPSGRPLLWGAALLVLGALALLAVLWPRRAEVPRATGTPATGRRAEERAVPPRAPSFLPPPAVTSSGRASSVAAVPSASGAPAKVDLFAGALPELLGMGRKVVEGGGRLHSAKLKEIYQYAKDNPTDARPHLLMGADSVNRGWDEFAIGHYERAFRADPRARHDARMLEDLVKIATSRHHGEKAEAALLSIYGASAVPAVLAAADRLTAEGQAAKAERLVRLSNLLGETAPPP